MTVYTVTKVEYAIFEDGWCRANTILGVGLTNQKAHQLAYPHTNPTGSNPLSIIDDLESSEELDADGIEHILIQEWDVESH